jgi:drug/metabolite transporter (DMT)-like permease
MSLTEVSRKSLAFAALLLGAAAIAYTSVANSTLEANLAPLFVTLGA